MRRPHLVRAGAAVPCATAVVATLVAGLLVGAPSATAAPAPPTTTSPTARPAASAATSSDDLPWDAVDGSRRTVTPTRLLDTRIGTGRDEPGPLQRGWSASLRVTGVAGIPTAGVAAVILNVTVTAPSTSGYITVSPTGTTRPTASNLNFVKGQTVPNLVIAPVGDYGSVELYNGSGGTVQLVADVTGYYFAGTPSAAGTLSPLQPARVLNTRTGVGATKTAVAPGGVLHLTVRGRGGVPSSSVAAVVLNVTVTAPTGDGYVTAWPDGTARPTASNLNFVRGQTVPNLVIAPVGANGVVDLYNGSAGSTQLVADVAGFFLPGTASARGTLTPVAPTRLLDTRAGIGAPRAAVAAGATSRLTVTNRAGLPAQGLGAVVLNVTVTAPTGSGYVTVWADGNTRPTVSNLNFVRGQTVPNLVVAPVGADGVVDLYNGSDGSVQLVADVTGFVLGTDRSVVAAAPKSSTVVAAANQLLGATPGPDGSTSITLARGVRAPAVGAGVVGASGGAVPGGVAGSAQSVTTNADGTTTVSTTPTTLDALYSDLDISVNRPLQASDVVTTSGGPRTDDVGVGATFDVGKADFTCTGAGSVQATTISADLSKFHVDFGLNVARRSVHAQLSLDPSFTIGYSFRGGAVQCSLAPKVGKSKLALHIPVSVSPPLFLDVSPVITISASSDATLSWTWTPHVAVGFDRGNGHDSDVHDFSSGGSATTSGGKVSFQIGVQIAISLAEVVGIGGTFGPYVQVSTRGYSCSTLEAGLRASLQATLDVLFLHVEWTFAEGDFARRFLRGCDWDEFPLLVGPSRVGNVDIGMGETQLRAAAGIGLTDDGPPDCRTFDPSDGSYGVFALFYPGVDEIRLFSVDDWVTTNGIHDGSSLAQVRSAYPGLQLDTDIYGELNGYVDFPDGTGLKIDFGYHGSGPAGNVLVGYQDDLHAAEYCG